MIVKVPKARSDGGSSFADLKAYLTEGIAQAGIDDDVGSFSRVTQCIIKESVLNALGEKVEKTIAVEIGNLSCLKTSAAEMRAVAAKNSRVSNPVYHYILSWPEGETPDPKAIFSAARDTLRALGVADHQYIIAIHVNTDNIHAHVAVNRVHPVSFKAAHLEWAHKTLHRAARELEISHGWKHDNGIYNVIEFGGKKRVVLSTEYFDPELVSSRGAADFETWHGEQSLETWCKGMPAAALQETLADPKTRSWQDIHRTLSKFGLQLRDSGGGGMRVHAIDPQSPGGEDIVGRASKALPFLKRKDLERRFGPFEAMRAGATAVQAEHTYKRDPYKRLDRRLERKAMRDALYARFLAEQRELRKLAKIAKDCVSANFAGDDQVRRDALINRYRKQRAAIKSDPSLNSKQKQQAYMLAKLTMLQARAQLRDQLLAEKRERRRLIPPVPTWREWVEEQAVRGDEAAISALRGLVYQQKRDGKKHDEPTAAADFLVNAICPTEPAYTDPYIRKISHLKWKVGRNGNVIYSFTSGASAFTDAGDKLVFGRAQVTDEALALTLQYAYDKWRNEIRVTGGDAVFQTRVAHIAAELGIPLKNPELQAAHRQAQERQARLAADLTRANGIPFPAAGETIEATLRRQYPTADITHAVTHQNWYSGRIIAHDARFVAQQVGKNKFVLHERSVFRDELSAEDGSITISYRSGQATVSTRKSRGR